MFAKVLAVLVAGGAGCRGPVRTAPAATAALQEDYCWWAVERTALPVDTVAARFASASATIGLTGVTSLRLGDTAVVHGGPSTVAAFGDSAEVRIVAFQKGDSTHYRKFVSLRRPTAQSFFGMCAQLAKSAAVQGVALREPDGEERMTVWTRRR